MDIEADTSVAMHKGDFGPSYSILDIWYIRTPIYDVFSSTFTSKINTTGQPILPKRIIFVVFLAPKLISETLDPRKKFTVICISTNIETCILRMSSTMSNSLIRSKKSSQFMNIRTDFKCLWALYESELHDLICLREV